MIKIFRSMQAGVLEFCNFNPHERVIKTLINENITYSDTVVSPFQENFLAIEFVQNHFKNSLNMLKPEQKVKGIPILSGKMDFKPKENSIKNDIFKMTELELFETAEITKAEKNIERLKIIIKEFFFRNNKIKYISNPNFAKFEFKLDNDLRNIIFEEKE